MLSFYYNQKLVTLLNTGVHGLFRLTGTRLNKAFTTRGPTHGCSCVGGRLL